MIPVNTQASKDSLVNKKIQEALNGGGHYWGKENLSLIFTYATYT